MPVAEVALRRLALRHVALRRLTTWTRGVAYEFDFVWQVVVLEFAATSH